MPRLLGVVNGGNGARRICKKKIAREKSEAEYLGNLRQYKKKFFFAWMNPASSPYRYKTGKGKKSEIASFSRAHKFLWPPDEITFASPSPFSNTHTLEYLISGGKFFVPRPISLKQGEKENQHLSLAPGRKKISTRALLFPIFSPHISKKRRVLYSTKIGKRPCVHFPSSFSSSVCSGKRRTNSFAICFKMSTYSLFLLI